MWRSAVMWLLPSALALAAGAVVVLAFAPFGWYPFAVLGLALFYHLIRSAAPRAAAFRGWLFGLGLFAAGVFWIRISLNEFGNLPAPIANGLMLVFVAAMALYYALAAWLIRRLQPPADGPQWVGPLLVLPSVWVLLEWLRGWLFTGFPWLLVGNAQINALPLIGAPLAGLAPVLGVHGLSLAVALSAGLVWCLVRDRRRAGWSRSAALAVLTFTLAVIWLGSALLARVEWTQPRGEPLSVSVLQGNVEQALKWEPDGLLPTLEVYLELTRRHLHSDVIVWPETAIPDFLHQVQGVLIEPLAETARAEGAEVVIGVPVMEDREHYYNGLISLGSAADHYYKRHLVPFGEFLPFKAQLSPLIDWFQVPMSDFSRGQAERPLLQVGSHAVGVSICYEDVFPQEVRQALPDAAYLINVSNDAWFGDSLAPHQHLEFARLRALENGRPLVRATNSGISAIIDHRGRVIDALPLFVRAGLVAEIQPRSGSTPFSRFGSLPTLLAAALMLLAAVVLSRRRQLWVGR
ncbi:apolipoprotein N-acyltransferase [Thiohalocapsa marina]|uniref:Apolipoprotein N-acyltransferase n=2 Tax=Thiohalocapsa marina TaxID=424902 RepID=A0A5M8FG84_9GAMM|nr:apolipoprotein N-acyltransferase [Thiohalocapsa marina]